MSRVFLAEDTRLGRKVVVKVLSPELAEGLSAQRFEREVRLAASLQQANIVPVLSVGEAGGLPFYTMPYVEGESLRARIARGERLSIGEVTRIVADVARALAFAHEHGVVHRDIKPDNVLLSGRTAVVTDFGVAKALESARPSGTFSTLTAIGTSVGTPAYMSPEQAAGEPHVDHRADIYALGCMAFELLTGHPPFHGRSAQRTLAAHVNEAPVPVGELRDDVPPQVADLVMRSLAKNPDDRPQDADEILRILEEMRPGSSGAVRSEAHHARGRGIAAAAAAVVFVVIAAASAWIWASRDAVPPQLPADSSADVHALAVLPFENTGGAPEDDYFSDGMTDELAHALARLPGIRLAGRTSSYAFKGRAVPAQQIGRELDVGAFISGTVRRAGDRIRVTAQLVSVRDGKVIQEAASETSTGDVFAVQDALTSSIVAAIAPALAAGRPPDAGSRGTADQEAYDLYLKGRHLYVARGADNLERSIHFFRRAVERDPNFARAHAGLAMAYTVLGVYAAGAADSALRLRAESARRAIELDSALADAQIVMGAADEYEERYDKSEERYRRALQLEPASVDAHHWFGYMLLSLGRMEEATTHLRQAERLDPLAKSPASAVGQALLHARRFDEAGKHARRLLELDSTYSLALLGLASSQLGAGRPDSAIATLERLRQVDPRSPVPYPTLVLAYGMAGRWRDADRLREELRSRRASEMETTLAFADLVFGDRRPMVRLAGSREGRRRLLGMLGTFGCNPLLDPLWDDRTFRDALSRTGVRPCDLPRAWSAPPRS